MRTNSNLSSNKYRFLMATFLLMSGCNMPNDHIEASASQPKEILREKVSLLEGRIAKIESEQKNSGQWVLWERLQRNEQPGIIVGYAPPQILGAFSTKDECLVAAQRRRSPDAIMQAEEPVTIIQNENTFYQYCMPKGVTPGFQRS